MAKKKRRTYDYVYVDDELEYLNREIAKRFSRLKSLLAVSEVNIAGEIGKVYRDLAVLIRKSLLAIARFYYIEMWEEERKYTQWLDEQWIEDILTGYDPVSKYVFANEEDRKRARLVEAVLASSTPSAEMQSAMKSLALMYKIYAVRVADEAVLQSLNDQDTKYVEWLAELDNRTCEVCWTRDGKVYPIDALPDKPHINCRCTVRRVKNYGKIDYASTRNG